MPEPTARELKLIQYLNEAYGKEKQLETVLQAQIKLFEKAAVKKRLQEHLKETKAQARGLAKRIKQLGGKAEEVALPGPDRVSAVAGAATSAANKAVAAAKGPIAALRGTSPADNQLRNLRDAFWNEAEEIAHYNIIEAFANELGDKETAKLAKEYRRQEERVQSFIEKQLPQFVKDVVKSEIPAKDRKPATAASSRRSSSRSSSRSSTAKRSTAKRSTAKRSTAKRSTAKRSTTAAKSTGSTSRASSARKSSASSRSKPAASRAKSSTAKSTTSRSASTNSRSKSSGTRKPAASRAKATTKSSS